VTIEEGVLEATRYISMHSTACLSLNSYVKCLECKSLSEDQKAIRQRYFVTSLKANSGLKVGQILSLPQPTFLHVIHSSCHLTSFRDSESVVKQSANKIHTFLTSLFGRGRLFRLKLRILSPQQQMSSRYQLDRRPVGPRNGLDVSE
jgi:hypothetical protein